MGSLVVPIEDMVHTPFMCALFYHHAEVAQLLLDNGASVTAENDLKVTPLHLAAQSGMTSMVTTLLQKGCLLDKLSKQAIKIKCLYMPHYKNRMPLHATL